MKKFEGAADTTKLGQWSASGYLSVDPDIPKHLFPAGTYRSFDAALSAMWYWAFSNGASEVWVNGTLVSRAT